MKLLITTIESGCERTDVEMKSLYSVVADSPMDVKYRVFKSTDLYTDIFEEITDGRFNIVYFHADRRNEAQLRRVADMVKKATPGMAIVFGGIEVSFETRRFMKENPFTDYVIRGEGEKVLYNFIKTLVDYDFDFENIPGLAYRDGDQIVVNPYDSPAGMDALPFPYDRFEAGNDIVFYESIRGTSDRTTYSQYLPDARVRALSLSRVCTELRYFLVQGVRKVVFLDRFFNYNSERAYRILEYIVNNDNGITSFEFNINGDDLDEETVRLLSEAREGQIIFHLDVASTNAEVLAAVGRSDNVYRLMYNTTKLLQNTKVRTEMHIRAGLPLETMELFEKSFNKTYGLAEGMPVHIDEIGINKGTVLRSQALKYGYIYAEAAPYEVIATGYMSADELLKIKKTARVVESYIGDGGFKRSIPRILNDTGIKPYELFNSIAVYVKENRVSSRMQKKEYLARLLYAYAKALYNEKTDDARLDNLKKVILSDLAELISEEDLIGFEKKGWETY